MATNGMMGPGPFNMELPNLSSSGAGTDTAQCGFGGPYNMGPGGGQHHPMGTHSMGGFAAPLFHGSGLNLSLNHGLDLTCPNYEGLNLSVSGGAAGGHQPHHQQTFAGQERPKGAGGDASGGGSKHQGLNLTQGNSCNGRGGKRGLEVGLNLSLQNGINLTNPVASSKPAAEACSDPAASSEAHSSAPSNSNIVLRKGNYLYSAQACSGYVNLATLNSGGGERQQQQQAPHHHQQPNRLQQQQHQGFDRQRQSPLNLEQRASPLNLTSAMPDGSGHQDQQGHQFFCPPQPQQQQQQQQPSNYSMSGFFQGSKQDDGKAPQNYPATDFNQEGFHQESYFQQAADGFVQGGSAAMEVAQPQQVAGFQQQQQQFCSPPQSLETGVQGAAGPAQEMANGRIRLFCSSCCQEFSNSGELTRHMERHNGQVYGAAVGGGGKSMAMWPGGDQAEYEEGGSEQQGDCQQPSLQQQQQQAAAKGNNREDAFLAPQCQPPGVAAPDALVDPAQPPQPQQRQQPQEQQVPAEIEGIVTASTNNSSRSKAADEPPETCHECSLTFPTGVDLKKHLDLAHDGRQGPADYYQCRVCSARLPDKPSLRQHLDAHARERPFQCGECGARLTNQTGLNRHVKRVHERQLPYSCPLCDKRFYERHDLQKHEARHRSRVPFPPCDVCGRGFVTRHARDRHRCPGPEGKFPCQLCGSKLETKVAWGVHMWRHTKDSKYIILDTGKGGGGTGSGEEPSEKGEKSAMGEKKETHS